ncbi:MAG: universal stress protein [Steroidobacteraceae bacterium]|jgi:nucleotide-binding universal stress UspA family protein
MYKKILVPIDSGSASERGLREAISVARDQGAEILLLHVVDEWPVAAGDIAAVNLDAGAKALRDAGAELLEQAAQQVRAGGIAVHTALIEELGVPVGECVVQRARQWPADLIVCGTHGRRGITRLLLGSNAEYIMHHSPVPVLLLRVPQPQHAA